MTEPTKGKDSGKDSVVTGQTGYTDESGQAGYVPPTEDTGLVPAKGTVETLEPEDTDYENDHKAWADKRSALRAEQNKPVGERKVDDFKDWNIWEVPDLKHMTVVFHAAHKDNVGYFQCGTWEDVVTSLDNYGKDN